MGISLLSWEFLLISESKQEYVLWYKNKNGYIQNKLGFFISIRGDFFPSRPEYTTSFIGIESQICKTVNEIFRYKHTEKTHHIYIEIILFCRPVRLKQYE